MSRQEVFQEDANQGLPGYITQATLMRPLTPILSARSDTFIIRAYGDVRHNEKIVLKFGVKLLSREELI